MSGCNLKEICEYAGAMNATLFPAGVGHGWQRWSIASLSLAR